MKKRMLSLFVATVMAVSVLPGAVLAETDLITTTFASEEASTISVSLTVETSDQRWLDSISTEVIEGATAMDVLLSALDEGGYSYQGAEFNYITAVTTPEGYTVSAYDDGINSGWMYMVNGESPWVGMNDYVLSEGDEILFYYTIHWAITRSSFDDVARSSWYALAVDYVTSEGLFEGTSDSTFSPQSTMTRAMVMTVLHRMSGDIDYVDGEYWYTSHMDWAMDAGISDGSNPLDSVTRAQLVTMLWRYMGEPEASDEASLIQYDDLDQVEDWALEAMLWACESGLLTGKSEDTLAPQDSATRAEVATIIMRLTDEG